MMVQKGEEVARVRQGEEVARVRQGEEVIRLTFYKGEATAYYVMVDLSSNLDIGSWQYSFLPFKVSLQPVVINSVG